MFLGGDDFGGYGSNANLVAAWATNMTLVTNSLGDPAATVGGTTVTKQFPGFVADDTFIYAFRFKLADWSQGATRILSICGSDGTEHIRLRCVAGKFELCRGTTLIPGATGIFSPVNNTEYWASLKGKIADAGGFVELKIDDITDISVTGQDTKNAGANTIPSGLLLTASVGLVISSLYIANGVVGDGNSDHPPILRARRWWPNANGDLSGYTALGGGTLAAELDDGATHDGDASYVSAAAPAGFNVNMGNMAAPSPAAIRAVLLEGVHRKTDAGACTVRMTGKVGASTTLGSTISPPTTFQTDQLPMGVKPGGGAWTEADVNSILGGFDRLT